MLNKPTRQKLWFLFLGRYQVTSDKNQRSEKNLSLVSVICTLQCEVHWLIFFYIHLNYCNQLHLTKYKWCELHSQRTSQWSSAWNSQLHFEVRDLIENYVMKLQTVQWTSGISNELRKPLIKSLVKRTLSLVTVHVKLGTLNLPEFLLHKLLCIL